MGHRYLFLLLAICLPFSSYGQVSTNKNYTIVRSLLDEEGSLSLENITYYDGLGRKEEVVQKGITPSGTDLYIHYQYNKLGQIEKELVPTVSRLQGGFASPEYGDDNFVLNKYELSLGRIMKQVGPGAGWIQKNKGVAMSYSADALINENPVRRFVVDETSSIVPVKESGTIPAQFLSVLRTTDEDGRLHYEVKDLTGKLILSRRVLLEDGSESQLLDTYYVYDGMNRLRYVLPPSISYLSNLDIVAIELSGYAYRYDYRGRQTSIKQPGADPVYYAYDDADHLAFSQTGNQRKKDECTFYLYDKQGRQVVMGKMFLYGATFNYYAEKVKTGTIMADYVGKTAVKGLGYTSGIVNLNSTYVTILSTNYYDSYDFLGLSCFRTNYSMDFYPPMCSYGVISENVRGMLTGTYIGQLDNPSKGELSSYFYDDQGRELLSYNSMLPGGHHNYHSTKYSFTGKPLILYKSHLSGKDGRYYSMNNQVEKYEYEYDHADRLTKTYYTRNGNRVLLSETSYDDYGRVAEKRRHNNTDTIRYTYNIRNWLTSISHKYYEEELFYENTADFQYAVPCYNGNISVLSAKQLRNKETNSFRLKKSQYKYDSLNRLTACELAVRSPLYRSFSEAFKYDEMGNVISTKKELWNELNIAYEGNHIKSITPAFALYPFPITGEQAFLYDANGNLVKNMDRNITTTSYNLLNLPDTIQFKNGNQICNSYLADGRKVKTVYKTYLTDIVVPQDQIYHGNEPYGLLTNEWNENYVYRDDGNLTLGDMGLYMILNSEGFVSLDYPTTWDNQVYTHNYYVRDHQGNVCLTYKVDGFEASFQSLFYYPSGGLIYPEEDTSFQPYMFGEKEYINMHGLRQYDFGGRYYDPMLVSTPTMDPMCESYYDVSPYSFLGNNPVNTIDPGGNIVIFINGMHVGLKDSGFAYWDSEGYGPSNFSTAVKAHFNDWNSAYYDGSLGGTMGLFERDGYAGNMSSYQRFSSGYESGNYDVASIVANLARDDNGKISESIKVIAHSMGAAYAKGFIQAIVEYAKKNPGLCQGLSIAEYDFAPYQPKSQGAVAGVSTFQYSHKDDPYADYEQIFGAKFMDTSSDRDRTHGIKTFYDQIKSLPDGEYIFIGGKFVRIN